MISLIVIFNLLWSEFVETNERHFELLLHILITHWLSVSRPRFVSTNSLQSKLKITINLILGAMNNIFHNMIILSI